VMIAARGVMAVRIIRACKDLGYATVAVYDDADIWALHAGLADEAYALAGADGYEDVESLIAVALRSGADAVHPGDGRLALDPAAAAAVRGHGLLWIGASVDRLARRPPARAQQGRGRDEGPVQRAHVDLLAGAARAVALGARIVAVSRRGILVAAHSAPRDAAAELAERARAIAGKLGIQGYGVAEFERLQGGDWQFLGVSARLTPEHAVVEEQSGVDIVTAQIALAFNAGAPLPQAVRDFWAFGFAVEAEDRARGALRAAGVVRSFQLPSGPGVRVDSALGEGQVIVPSRDNRLAFVTVSARTETQARERLPRVADEISVRGVTTAVWLPGAAGPADPEFTDVAPDTGVVELEVRRGGMSVRLAFRLTRLTNSVRTLPAGGEINRAGSRPQRRVGLAIQRTTWPVAGVERLPL
jgi:propionyl-CoA carboxylase alpha chain